MYSFFPPTFHFFLRLLVFRYYISLGFVLKIDRHIDLLFPRRLALRRPEILVQPLKVSNRKSCKFVNKRCILGYNIKYLNSENKKSSNLFFFSLKSESWVYYKQPQRPLSSKDSLCLFNYEFLTCWFL